MVLLVMFLEAPFAFLVWLFEEAFVGIFMYVLSGEIFVSTWNRIHAGSALDQPTIGKHYFWFTVLAVLLLPYMAAIKKIFKPAGLAQSAIFKTAAAVLCLFLLCLLTIPFFWLLQYMCNMGLTGKRIFGLIYGICCYAVIIIFIKRLVKKP